jgi:hypothetical protein
VQLLSLIPNKFDTGEEREKKLPVGRKQENQHWFAFLQDILEYIKMVKPS